MNELTGRGTTTGAGGDMRAVWKFTVRIGGVTDLDMPKGATLLHVQVQRATPCLWALVDPTAEKEKRSFCWVGTGHPMDIDGDYVGTIQSPDETLVFHLFEVMA